MINNKADLSVDSVSKYEPTPYMKRIIIFNRKLEVAYQSTRKHMNDMLFGDFTPEEEAEWELSQQDTSGRLSDTKRGKNATVSQPNKRGKP